MCCIAVQRDPKNVIPESHINQMGQCNDDGFGLMYLDKSNHLSVYKTLTLSDFKTEYAKVCEELKDTKNPIVLHFRAASSGGVSLENCHPFWVNKETAVVHNGVFSYKSTKSESDTNLVTKDILSKIPTDFIYSQPFDLMFLDFCGNDKLVFLNETRGLKILNEKLGVVDGDIWYSNGGFRSYSNSYNVQTTICDVCKKSCLKSSAYNIEIAKVGTVHIIDVCDQCMNISLPAMIEKAPIHLNRSFRNTYPYQEWE